MTEHEKLKIICDEILHGSIGDNNTFRIGNIFYNTDIKMFQKINSIEKPAIKTIDVREIIFTQEFMDKYADCLIEKQGYKSFTIKMTKILESLDNPVDYLYNLLELGNKKN